MKNHSSLHIDQHKQSFRNGVFQQNQFIPSDQSYCINLPLGFFRFFDMHAADPVVDRLHWTYLSE